MLIGKVRDVKDVFTEVLSTIQENALVLYSMSHQVERNFVPYNRMADCFRRLKIYPKEGDNIDE
jgi:hypothetical protein